MQKILRKRILRELRSNALRYLALGLLVVLCMYLIVSLVSAADTVIGGVDELAETNRLEDGEFTVFTPLTQAQEKKLEEAGVKLERMFYLDFAGEGQSTLRLFRNRKSLNLLRLERGRMAKAGTEVVLEKRYGQERGLSLGDSIPIGERDYTVVGFGSVPDYDAPLKEISDSSVDSWNFGMAFVEEEQYERLVKEGRGSRSESYTYAYIREGRVTDKEIKELLQEFPLFPETVRDPWFQEYWELTGGKKDEIKHRIQQLADGTGELQEGLNSLAGNNRFLSEGAGTVFQDYLEQASEGLLEYGLTQELTEENYEALLEKLEDSSDSALLRLKISMVLSDLKNLEQYKKGTETYTEGVASAAQGAGHLYEGTKELQGQADELLSEHFDTDIENLTQFLTAGDNPRIKASSGDQVINKVGGLIAGVIVLILFSYVISVFVIHKIEEESSIIGTLYALGARKRELIIHYLTLPVMVTAVSGIIGTCIGFSAWGLEVQIQDCYQYFSVPALPPVRSLYLVAYGVLVPPVFAALVNLIVMNRRLSGTALSLIRKEQKESRIHDLQLGDMKFIGRFRIRQMLREVRSIGTVVWGMFISLLILLLGVNCYVMCRHISDQNRKDTRFEYMYTYKYPEEEVPEGGEGAYAVPLQRDNLGYRLDVTLLGVQEESNYFNVEVPKGESRIALSSAAAQKFGIEKGEVIVLTDSENGRDYAFTVDSIAQYSTALYAFMDIGSMRELFGQKDIYFNTVFSQEPLDIPTGRLYAVTSKDDIRKSSGIFIELMMPMVWMMLGVAALVFFTVMYLMMKVMIDRSSYGISLMKVFGYRTKEIRKLYLNGNFYMIAVGAAVCLPLAKKVMDSIYPFMVANAACAMDLSFSWQLYLGIYGGILGLYFIINGLLVRKLKKSVPANILKNRE